MARNGSGTYNLPLSPAVSGTTATAAFVNTTFTDLANALTQSLSKDGQTTPTANLPMGGFRLTGLGNATARTDAAPVGQVQNDGYNWAGTAGGTADALTLTPSPAITAYAAGQRFRFIAAADNTGAATVAVSGLMATAIQFNGSALTAGQIATGKLYEVIYDGTQFQINLTPAAVGTIVQAYDADLAAIAALTPTDGQTLVWSSGWTAGSVATSDAVARDMAASALAYAMASNDAASITGGVGAFLLSDDFETDSLATKTNATYDATNDWYSNSSTVNGLTGGTASASSADGASVAGNASDGNTATFWQAGSNQETGGWWQYDLGVGNTAAFDTWRQYWDGTSSGIETANILASATGAFAGEEITVASGVDFNLNAGAGWYEVSFTAPGTAYRYWRIVSQTTVNTTNGLRPKVFEFEAITSFQGNMTLRPTAATITADPSDVVGYFVYDPVDSVTLGTDLTVEYSIDNGSTWATATLTALGALGASGLLMFRAEADVSGQTGTSLVYSLETFNSKQLRYKAHVGSVPLY